MCQNIADGDSGHTTATAKAFWAALDSEERSALARKAIDTRTPEQRSASAPKAHLTRKDGDVTDSKRITLASLNGKHTKPGGDHPDLIVLVNQGVPFTISRDYGLHRISMGTAQPMPVAQLN